MAYTHFKPKAGRYGAHPVFVSVAPTVTANTTANTVIPFPKRRAYFSKATVTLSTIGSDADGTILVTLYAVGTDGSTARALTSALSFESNGVATALVPVDFTISATDNQRFLLEGETLRVAVVSNSAAIDTPPVGSVAVELLVLE